ncbi:PcfJ domain-containing protein [Bremerella sp. JC817]|uniref:PcfJ domain-containing protein n=1 Tax=Bremerella sp. JC817 TaxID=3231756 RepID=UPI0034589DD4
MRSRDHYFHQIVDELLACHQPSGGNNRRAYWNLVTQVRRLSDLLSPGPGRPIRDPMELRAYIRTLKTVAEKRLHWASTPESWIPPQAKGVPLSHRVTLRSLMGHLFERYPVPDFMAYSWLSTTAVRWHEALYLHLASGKGVRQFPDRSAIPLPPKAARFFMQAPDDFTPTEAMRWSQLRSYGVRKKIATDIARYTTAGSEVGNESFWETVFRFFVRENVTDEDEAFAIYDFIEEQKFRPGIEVWGRGADERPLQPDFTMKGRTLKSLRRHMVNWREQILAKRPELAMKTFQWDSSPFQSMVHQEGNVKWLMFELLSDRALILEGAAMDHCVATYIDSCAKHQCSIWSLRLHEQGSPKRMATIEVMPNEKSIVQAKGKCNNQIDDNSHRILEYWAEREGLKLEI